MPDHLIFLGYAHASLVGILRPDVAYPNRKIVKGRSAFGSIRPEPCDCPDGHIEVWVRKVAE